MAYLPVILGGAAAAAIALFAFGGKKNESESESESEDDEIDEEDEAIVPVAQNIWVENSVMNPNNPMQPVALNVGETYALVGKDKAIIDDGDLDISSFGNAKYELLDGEIGISNEYKPATLFVPLTHSTTYTIVRGNNTWKGTTKPPSGLGGGVPSGGSSSKIPGSTKSTSKPKPKPKSTTIKTLDRGRGKKKSSTKKGEGKVPTTKPIPNLPDAGGKIVRFDAMSDLKINVPNVEFLKTAGKNFINLRDPNGLEIPIPTDFVDNIENHIAIHRVVGTFNTDGIKEELIPNKDFDVFTSSDGILVKLNKVYGKVWIQLAVTHKLTYNYLINLIDAR